MADSVAAIAGLLSCPDDGAPLNYGSRELQCSNCARRFAIHCDNLAEILPQRPCDLPPAVNTAYRKSYLQAFGQRYSYDEISMAWGAEENVSESWVRKRRRQVAMVQQQIIEGTRPGESVLCDIAAGAGYYTFAYAHLFRFVLHCDLSVHSLNYAWRRARIQGIRNIVFLRVDYFAPPFQQSLDRILCMDTLIRGEEHDSALLRNIARSLSPEGSAVVDFHNWWHNPLRRLGLFPENFGSNRSYRRPEAEQLLRQIGLGHYSLRPFLQEFSPDSAAAGFVSKVLPSTRLVYRFARPRTIASPCVLRCAAGEVQ